MSIRVRFAPSPTGIPHIGNTRTALFNYLFARHNKGKLILRIEDTDRERLVPGSLKKILQILKTVGITWDEGPYIQSERLPIYQEHAELLVKKKLAYYCFCTKERLVKLRGQGYDQHCLKLSPAEVTNLLVKKTPHVIRLRVPDQGVTGWDDLIQSRIEFKNELLDDQVLLKSDGYPTYHLAVVIDDHLMKISHILRGVEWISSTPKHLLLYQAFGWPIPQIGHFPVILGPDKAKLSKRHGAKSILDYQAEGYLPEALVTFMAYLGWSYQDNSQLLTMEQLINLFDLTKVQIANSIFDLKKLNYFNAKLIRQTPPKTLLQLIKPYLKLKISDKQLAQIIPLIQERMIKLGEINDLIDYFVNPPKVDKQALLEESKLSAVETKKYLQEVIQVIKVLKSWTVKNLETDLHQLQQKLNLSPRQAFMTLRLVVTARPATPPLFDIIYILGKDEAIKRLNYAQKTLE
ncbi:MAG: glutamate--tRNA ligase [Candidatus Beckwithbacteria bacterium]|nr:glutamate--tRNA ligase [Candidatus Beckwithbacteria bacterium]